MSDKKLDAFTKSLCSSLCFLDNPVVRWVVIALLVLYCVIGSPGMLMSGSLFNNVFMKLFLVLFIVYVSLKDKTIAILLVIMFVMTMQSASMRELKAVSRDRMPTYELMEGEQTTEPVMDKDASVVNTQQDRPDMSGMLTGVSMPSMPLEGGMTGQYNPMPSPSTNETFADWDSGSKASGPVAANTYSDCIIKNKGRTGQNGNDLSDQCTGVGTWQNSYNAQGMNFPSGNDSNTGMAGSPF